MKTQKTYITFLLFLLVGTSLAQVAVGIKVNNPLLYGSSPGGFESNSGLEISRSGNWGIINAGVFVRISLKKHLALHTELLYKNEGAGYHYSSLQSSYYSGRFTYTYIDMPVLLQLEGKRLFRGFFQIGLSPKFLLTATHSADNLFFDRTTNIYSKFNKVVLAAHIGGGVMWDLDRVVLMGDVRISPNLTPIAGRVYDVNFSKARSLSVTMMSFSIAYKLTKN